MWIRRKEPDGVRMPNTTTTTSINCLPIFIYRIMFRFPRRLQPVYWFWSARPEAGRQSDYIT